MQNQITHTSNHNIEVEKKEVAVMSQNGSSIIIDARTKCTNLCRVSYKYP